MSKPASRCADNVLRLTARTHALGGIGIHVAAHGRMAIGVLAAIVGVSAAIAIVLIT